LSIDLLILSMGKESTRSKGSASLFKSKFLASKFPEEDEENKFISRTRGLLYAMHEKGGAHIADYCICDTPTD
jgi:hypothetical protein